MVETIGHPLVTVVATFYNLEGFAAECVQSIVSQRDFSDFEVILVDDGSTDATPRLLSLLAEGHPYVRFLSQVNMGVAEARNRGVREARGDLITFVDGDDVVSPDHLASLVSAYQEHCAGLAVAAPVNIRERSKTGEIAWPEGTASTCYDAHGSLVALLYERITEAPWGKLASRQLYLEHPFPGNHRYEDVAVATEHVRAAGRVCTTCKPTYGYRMRKGSVVHPTNADLAQASDFMWAICRMLGDIEITDDDVASGMLFRTTLLYLRLRTLLKACEGKEAREFEHRVTREIQALAPVVLRDQALRAKDTLRLDAFMLSPRLYDALLEMYDKVLKGV